MNKEILMNLSWHMPKDTQEKAVNNIATMDDVDIKLLIQPYGKEHWENSAKALYKIGYPKISEIIPQLFSWLQDMNWPGSFIIKGVLEGLPRDVFIKYYEYAIKEALETNDEIWIYNLSDFFSYFSLKENDFKSKEIYLKLLESIQI